MHRLILLALVFGATHKTTWAGELRAGAATADITPPVGMPMWGYAARHDAPSVGIRDRLFARALVLDDGALKVAIVSLDLGRPPTRANTHAIRERLRPLSVNHILLVASHTHHGPVLELDDLPNPQNPYNRFLENSICEAIKKAAQTSTPARLGVGAKEIPLNRNRQSKRQDAPVDRTLTVVRVETTQGKCIATLVNFAAHPTMLDAKLLEFSAEWPGAMAKAVEKETGAPCLFLQGAAGDLTAKPLRNGTPEDFGAALAGEAMGLSKGLRCETANTEMKAVREEFHFKSTLNVSDPLVKFSLGRAFFPALVAFYEREYREGVRPEMTALLLAPNIGMAGFSGEMFCGHALSLRRRARLDYMLICGYCNDYQQYFPTIEAMAEGGYGTAPPIAVSEPGAGERMTDRALVQLYRLRGKMP